MAFCLLIFLVLRGGGFSAIIVENSEHFETETESGPGVSFFAGDKAISNWDVNGDGVNELSFSFYPGDLRLEETASDLEVIIKDNSNSFSQDELIVIIDEQIGFTKAENLEEGFTIQENLEEGYRWGEINPTPIIEGGDALLVNYMSNFDWGEIGIFGFRFDHDNDDSTKKLYGWGKIGFAEDLINGKLVPRLKLDIYSSAYNRLAGVPISAGLAKVPEPSTAFLALLSLGAFGFQRKRF